MQGKNLLQALASPIVDSFCACPAITVSSRDSLTSGVLHSACQTRPALPKLIPETGSLMELEQFSGWKVGRWRMVSSLRNKYSGLATSVHRPVVVVVVEEVVVEVIIVVEVIVVVKVVVEVIFVVVFVVVEVEVGAEIAVVEVVVVVIIVGLEVVVVVLGLLVVVGVVFRGTSGRRRKRRRVVRLMRMMRTELRTEQTL